MDNNTHEEEKGIAFPNLVQKLTVEEINQLRELLLDLQTGLEQVPASFDEAFSYKINAILDILKEVDSHSSLLKNAIVESQQKARNLFIEDLQKERKQLLKNTETLIDDKLNKKLILSKSYTFFISILCSFIAGLGIGFVFYFLI